MAKKLMIYDASEKSFVGMTWKAGATLFSPYFDKILAVHDWTDCERLVKELPEKYDEVQFWGHGSPGFIYVNKQPATASFWFALSEKVNPNANVWLRVCYFAATSFGKTMMNQISKNLNARVIAHTYSIGQWACQSGTRAVTPTALAAWPSTEGVGADKSFSHSAPWAPNTVSALSLTPPKWATNK